ncbi:FTR1 family iron permease [Candidatus Nitrosotenuis cloacae]|uniref:Iron permease n=1 Tax=Candidatus Nitrosotenuis cloacae TaxID=1603555 RepID=A0A3G1AZJ2_9ARCH|nr:FTR1 family protein [Candidatus Nitrosotenuis cloacae]AJZ75310.1 iron permease [Candidatus Nitrosotenuis cloacae]
MKQFLILALVVSVIFSAIPYSSAESQDIALADATGRVVTLGIDMIRESIQNNSYDSALKYSKFTTDFYSAQIYTLRSSNIESADDLHLLLIDIHSKIARSASSDEIFADLDMASQYVSKFPTSTEPLMVASHLLSASDQSYQLSKPENNGDHFYIIADSLRIMSFNLFNSNSAPQERQADEIRAFYLDLQQHMDAKKDFVSIGKLITTIQRDITGTDTVLVDSANLYNVIRDLYSQTDVELQAGNYEKAEELVIAAYLDNFEYLEADIEIVDETLLHTMELNMREELRAMVKEKKSPEEIMTFINDPILKDLEKAEGLVSNLKRADPQVAHAAAAQPKLLNPMGSATDDQKSGVRAEIDFIRATLETMLVQYQNQDYTAAFTSARTAYLDSYEHVEIPLRSIDPDFTLEVELQFAELRQLINEKADFSQVQEAAIKVRRSLDESERLVTGTGQLAPAIAFTSSFAVIFREGLESVLILGAILTYLEASRNTRFKKYVHYGIVLAIAATAVTWVVAAYLIKISGANRELIEAIAALSATAVLFYVSFWILNKIEHKKWMEFVKAKVWQASTTGGVAVFVMLSFFTVYREGFETVLFYEAMFGFAKYMELYVGLGFVLGIGTLLGIYYVTRKLGKRLPLKMLFGLTMGVGAYLSIAFLGNAIRELQTLDIVPFTSMLGIIPRLDINLAKMTGIYPTLETLIGQLIMLGIYMVAASYVLVLRPKREEKIATMRKSRREADEPKTN